MAERIESLKHVKAYHGQLLMSDTTIVDPADNDRIFEGASGKKYLDISSQTYKTSIAKIRASSNLNPNIIYKTMDFGVPGEWQVDESDTTSPDNTGTVLVNQSGQRLKRKYEGPVHSIWFNIVGDGVNNNTDALKSLIEDYSFPYIYINKGHYRVEGTVLGNRNFVVPSNTRIELDDEAVIEIIPGSDGYRLFAMNAVENVIIDGGTIVGDRDEHTGLVLGSSLIDIRNQCKNIVVRNTKIRDSFTDGIYIGGGASSPGAPLNCEDIWVENVQVSNSVRNGMSITNAKSVKVVSSIFENSIGENPQSGIDLEPNQDNIVEDIQFTGCTFRGNANQGIMSTGNNATFINCYSYDNGQRGAWIAKPNHTIIGGAFYNSGETNIYLSGDCTNVIIKGVLTHGSGLNGIDVHAATGAVQIEGCVSRDNAGIGILASPQSGFPLDKCVFSNNVTYNNNGVGINIDCSDSTIIGNVVTESGSYGINLLGDGNIVSNNNILKSTHSGIRIQGNKNVLSDNYIRSSSQLTNNTYDNILVVSGASGNIIRDSTIYPGSEINKPRFSIRINDSTCADNIIMHCVIDSTGQTGEVSDLGTNTVMVSGEPELQIGSQSGEVGIVGGNSVLLRSLAPDATSNFNTYLPGPGVRVVSNSSGSVGFPGDTGSMLFVQRAAGTTAGSFAIWVGSANTGDSYINIGTTGTSWTGWFVLADNTP